MLKFVLEGEVGCKKNSNRFDPRSKRVYKNKRFAQWHSDAVKQMSMQAIPAVPVRTFRAEFVLYHGTLRRVDSDNQVTSLLDLLQDVNVIEDDCWTYCRRKTIDDVYRKGAPGAEIIIYPLTEGQE